MRREFQIAFFTFIASLPAGLAVNAAMEYFPALKQYPGLTFWSSFLTTILLLGIAAILAIRGEQNAEMHGGQRRMIPFTGMIVFGLGFCICAAWYFWPQQQPESANNTSDKIKVPIREPETEIGPSIITPNTRDFYTTKQKEAILDTLDDIMRVAKDYSRKIEDIILSAASPPSLAGFDFSRIRPPHMSEEQERTWDAEQVRSQKFVLELRIDEIDSYLKTITGLESSLLNQDTLENVEYYTPLSKKILKKNEYSKSIIEIKSSLNKCRSSLVSNRELIGKYNDAHLSALLLKPSTCDDIANGLNALLKLLEETKASIKQESELLKH